jgi:hypothetical protein
MEELLERLQEEEGIEQAEERAVSTQAAEQGAVKEAVYEGLLRPHGNLPNSKQHGIFRVLCENPNSLNNQIMDNPKLAKAINLKDELDADCLLYCKHRLNLHHKDNRNDFKQMFQ